MGFLLDVLEMAELAPASQPGLGVEGDAPLTELELDVGTLIGTASTGQADHLPGLNGPVHTHVDP
jgi:hypothetical protein